MKVAGDVEAVKYYGDGSALTGIQGIPSGVIVMWSGSVASIPAGWHLCDGAAGTPNLRNRFIVGAGSSYGVDATGGANSVTLSIAQMPSHSHPGDSWTSYAPDHSHNSLSGGDVNCEHGSDYKCRITGNHNTGNAGKHRHKITGIKAQGGGGSHENRPPYYALAYIMKL
ncbi:MAG: hypothetical protein KAK00_10395 [Nanoarchaeota archaeon]|nr:hypothetical protein [Nanoarchaeota archaeon]